MSTDAQIACNRRRRRLTADPFHRAGLAAALVMIAGLGAGTAAASAKPASVPAWPKPWAARIVTPGSGAVITDGTVDVTVQLAPGAKTFRAWVDDARVTGSYRSTDGGRVREATLRVGRTPGLGYGRRILYVQTRGRGAQQWWAERHIVLARPAIGLLSGVSARRVPGAGVDVTVITATTTDRVSLQVDGGRRLALSGSGRRHQLRLTADAGLHPGPNLISVRAVDAKRGRYEVRRVSLELPAGVPVAGAGAAHRSPAGRAVRFSASATNIPQGMRPRYRWTIATRPAGSRATLRQAGTAHPVLRPDRIGRYALRLTVTGARGGHGARAAVVSDSATTTLDATPNSAAIGVPIDTIQDQGITIASQHYPVPISGDALQLLVLSRSTLAEVSNTSYTNDDTGASALLAAVQNLTDDDLVIIAKPIYSTNNASDAAANATINKALAAIGADPVAQQVSNGATACYGAMPCSVFSAIGVPGIPAGQGHVNGGLAGLSGHAAGDLHGYLQQDPSFGNYAFTDTERVPFNTGDPTADPAVVTVGSNESGSPFATQTYSSQNLDGGAGFFVVILSAGNLAPISQQTFADTAAGLGSMHTLLSRYTQSQNALVIVRSIGAVTRVSDPAWDEVATDLHTLGGSSLYFNALSGTATSYYAQVAPGASATGYPSPWTQIASHQRTGSGQLSGLLAYNPLGQLYPDESVPVNLQDPSRPLAGTLPGLISLPSSGWPEDSYSTDEQNALNCIAANVNSPGGGLRTPIQVNYTNANLVGQWADFKETIDGDGYFTTLSGDGCGPFSQSDFNTVKSQLDAEWTAIPAVWSLIANLQSVLIQTNAATEVASVAQQVNQSVAAGSATVHYDADGIASDALWALSTIPGFSGSSDALNFIAASLGLASEVHSAKDGSSADQVSTTATNFASTLSDQLTGDALYLGTEREILLGDWTKLQTAAANADGLPAAPANWAWTAKQAAQGVDGLMVAVRRLSYQTLFPAAYSLYRLQAGTGSLPTNPASYVCSTLDNGYFVDWYPFSAIPQYGNVDVTTEAAGAQEDWVYARPGVDLSKHGSAASLPSAGLLAAMFGPPAANDPYQAPDTALFNAQAFPLDAYQDATVNITNVTHTSAKGIHGSTNSICQG